MKMNLISGFLVFGLGVASAQQAGTSTNATVSSGTSVSADKSGASVQSESKVNASSNTSLSGSKQKQEDTKSKHAKTKDDSGSGANANTSLSAGTAVNAVLAKPIDSRKCKEGDPVIATAAEDVKSDGKVVIRKGSKLMGHVTKAEAKGEGSANSSLGIVFDHAILKGGEQVQMNSVVQAIAAGHTEAPMTDDTMGTISGGAGMTQSGSTRGGGLLGGVGSTASAATGAVANVGGNATGGVGSTVGSTANRGNGLQGALGSNSSGVIGLKGLSLESAATNSTQGSVITSTGKSVHLDSGTQLLLKVVN